MEDFSHSIQVITGLQAGVQLLSYARAQMKFGSQIRDSEGEAVSSPASWQSSLWNCIR